jgi:hypothetical protein
MIGKQLIRHDSSNVTVQTSQTWLVNFIKYGCFSFGNLTAGRGETLMFDLVNDDR